MDIKKGILKVKVKTGAAKNGVLGWDKDVLRIAVKAQPEKGKANIEIIKFFKKKFDKNVKIVKGLKSKDKVLKVNL